jgi:hypothetical protein
VTLGKCAWDGQPLRRPVEPTTGEGHPAGGSREPVTPERLGARCQPRPTAVKGKPTNDDGERGKLSGSCPRCSEEVFGEIHTCVDDSVGWFSRGERKGREAGVADLLKVVATGGRDDHRLLGHAQRRGRVPGAGCGGEGGRGGDRVPGVGRLLLRVKQLTALAEPGRHAPWDRSKPRPRGAGLYVDRLTMWFTWATKAPKCRASIAADPASFINPHGLSPPEDPWSRRLCISRRATTHRLRSSRISSSSPFDEAAIRLGVGRSGRPPLPLRDASAHVD